MVAHAAPQMAPLTGSGQAKRNPGIQLLHPQRDVFQQDGAVRLGLDHHLHEALDLV
jgi:propanediol utilization protein